jgi:hypothetical protein
VERAEHIDEWLRLTLDGEFSESIGKPHPKGGGAPPHERGASRDGANTETLFRLD